MSYFPVKFYKNNGLGVKISYLLNRKVLVISGFARFNTESCIAPHLGARLHQLASRTLSDN